MISNQTPLGSDQRIQETAQAVCPNCELGVMQVFYEVRNIPAHSVLLMPTRERALTYPRRDLRLGFLQRFDLHAHGVLQRRGELLDAQHLELLPLPLRRHHLQQQLQRRHRLRERPRQ